MVLILSVSRTRISHHRGHQLKAHHRGVANRDKWPSHSPASIPTCRTLPAQSWSLWDFTPPNPLLKRILVGCINCLLKCQIGLLFIFFWLLRLIYCRPKNEANCTNSWLIYIYIYIYIYVFLFVSLTFLNGILNWNVSSMDSEIIKSNCSWMCLDVSDLDRLPHLCNFPKRVLPTAAVQSRATGGKFSSF